jgi:endonuclease-3 related protein
LEKADCLSIEKISQLGRRDINRLRELIKPSGFYNQKAKRLVGLCRFLQKEGGIMKFFQKDKDYCREKLLSLYGIGEETADSILLYAGDKLTFVIDEYTKRFVKKHNLAKKLSYQYLQNIFENNLPKRIRIYQGFHAIIVLEGKV